VKIYNSIFWNNSAYRIGSNGFAVGVNELHINNSLIQGGINAVLPNHFIDLHWGRGNFEEDPLFTGDPNAPFQLSFGSPGIDAGTLEINFPDYIYPETDIMGNPRVTNGRVDIGAFQFQGLYADFDAESISGPAPLTVQFINQSTAASSFDWDLTGDGSIDSIEENPAYTYYEPGMYNVKLRVSDGTNATEVFKPAFITVVLYDEDDVQSVTTTQLHGNYPNPFNPETLVNYSIESPSFVVMEIFNVKGQKVRSLLNTFKEAGHHHEIWNGLDDHQRAVGSGVYFIRMDTKDYSATRRMVLMK
jgi:hypothetical protein